MAVPRTNTMALFVGSHFKAADHGTCTRAEVLDAALRWLER